MYVCIYIYIYISILYTCVYIYIHMYIYIHTHVSMCVYIQYIYIRFGPKNGSCQVNLSELLPMTSVSLFPNASHWYFETGESSED